jgi:multidrug efflux pump subunit AcrA (membrane-fusion protein)
MKLPGLVALLAIAAAAVGAYTLLDSRSSPPADQEDATPTLVSVQVGTLGRKTVHRYVTGYGVVTPAPATAGRAAAAAAVAAPVAGVVARVAVVAGQEVRRGQELVELDSGTMTAAYATQELARQRKLYAEHNTSLKALQAAQASLSLLRVTAPLAGRVVAVNVKPGASVGQTASLVEIMDLRRLVVRAGIPEDEAAELAIGQSVELPGACPGIARLSYIGSTVDTSDGTVSAWAQLPANCALRPGRYVALRIVTATHSNVLVAPSGSVVSDLAGNSVLAVVHGNTAIRTSVQAGFRDDGWTEVSAPGLAPGMKVVTVGAYGLPRRTAIRVVHPPPMPAAARQSRFGQLQ